MKMHRYARLPVLGTTVFASLMLALFGFCQLFAQSEESPFNRNISPASPLDPQAFGKIAFSRFTPGFETHYEIYKMDSDGANPVRLTIQGPNQSDSSRPSWSPD